MIARGSVRLTPVEPSNVYTYKLFRNDPTILRWSRRSDLSSYPDIEKWLKDLGGNPNARMFDISVEGPSVPVHVGVCGLTGIDWVSRRAEFSVGVFPECHRKGYARDALSALLAHGFESLNLHSIWGETLDGNPAAKLFEGLGFVKEGTRREAYFKEGRHYDAHIYSYLAREWRSRRGLDVPSAPVAPVVFISGDNVKPAPSSGADPDAAS